MADFSELCKATVREVESILNNNAKCYQLHIEIDWKAGDIPLVRYDIDNVKKITLDALDAVSTKSDNPYQE